MVNGRAVDLLIRASVTGSYDSPADSSLKVHLPTSEGQAAVATLSLRAGSKVSANFSFVAASTDEAVVMPPFLFSIFGLEDHGVEDEELLVNGFHEVFMNKSAGLQYRPTPGGYIFWPRPAQGRPSSTAAEKAIDMTALAPHAVTFLFTETSWFPLTLGCSPDRAGGDWTVVLGSADVTGMFGLLLGSPQVPTEPGELQPASSEQAPPTKEVELEPDGCPRVDCELQFTKVTRNDLEAAGELRWADACGDGSVDLVVALSGPGAVYRPRRDVKSGIAVEGPYGLITLQNASRSELVVRLVRAGSSDLAEPRSFILGLFGMFQDMRGEGVSVATLGFRSFVLASDSTLQHESVGGGVRLQSIPAESTPSARFAGYVPYDPVACSPEQSQVAALLLFQGVARFPLTLEVFGGGLGRGRNFYLGGRSCFVQNCEVDGRGVPSVAAPVPPTPRAPSHVHVEETFDCLENLLHWQKQWTFEQKLWCCSNKELGCHDCVQPQPEWTPDRRDWCCRARQVGCDVTGGSAVIATTAMTVPLGFDCGENVMAWRTAWSVDQKEWCCDHEGLGCYDCSGRSEQWDSQQQNFCCRSRGIGCADPASDAQGPVVHSCREGLENFEAAWTDQKKAWCCAHEYLGCSSAGAMHFQRKFRDRTAIAGAGTAAGYFGFTAGAVAAVLATVLGRRRLRWPRSADECLNEPRLAASGEFGLLPTAAADAE